MLTKDFYYDDNFKNIGVKLSGGADSSIVYYMLCEHTKDKDVDIYVITIGTPKKPWYPDGAKRIIDIVGKLTGKYPTKHLTRMFPHVDYETGQKQLVAESRKNFNLDIVYSGLTMNVENEEFKNKLLSNKEIWNLDENMIYEQLGNRDKTRDFKKNATKNPRRPFGHSDKMASYEAYEINYMLDKLYPYTYSCERLDTPIEKYNGVENMVHCNNCFFCFERLYAFGRLV